MKKATSLGSLPLHIYGFLDDIGDIRRIGGGESRTELLKRQFFFRVLINCFLQIKADIFELSFVVDTREHDVTRLGKSADQVMNFLTAVAGGVFAQEVTGAASINTDIVHLGESVSDEGSRIRKVDVVFVVICFGEVRVILGTGYGVKEVTHGLESSLKGKLHRKNSGEAAIEIGYRKKACPSRFTYRYVGW